MEDGELMVESLEGICCVCGHKLHNHIDESNGWRCHSIGHDWYQCECWLRKDRADGDRNYYDCITRKFRLLQEEGVDLSGERVKNIFLDANEQLYYEKKVRNDHAE